MISQLKSCTKGLLRNGESAVGLWYAGRVRLGVALIVVFSVLATARPLESCLSSHTLSRRENVFKYESRFDQVKKNLPPGQIIGYSDDFTCEPGKQCGAFVLAQYSLAPSVLEAICSQCGYVAKTEQVSAHWSGLLLENIHDPKSDPYLSNLLPPQYFQRNSPAPAPDLLFPSNQINLVQDFGDGVRLYEIEDK